MYDKMDVRIPKVTISRISIQVKHSFFSTDFIILPAVADISHWGTIKALHAFSFYKKRSYKKRPIDFGFIRNGDPLNCSVIRNKKALFFKKLR